MPFHIDRRERTGRTEVLTSTAADAHGLVDSRDAGAPLILWVEGHHLDGTRGAYAGTMAALHLIGDDHTVLLYPYGMTNLRARFLLQRDWADGIRRTYVGAAVTLRAAVAAFVAHHRLHQREQAVAGA